MNSTDCIALVTSRNGILTQRCINKFRIEEGSFTQTKPRVTA